MGAEALASVPDHARKGLAIMTAMVAVPEERKNAILESAKLQILGGATLEQIAAQHDIAKRTLQYWLQALGDEYIELRKAWVDSMLSEAGEELEASDDGLRLARARELWKRATWYAERRDRARYGDEKAQINIGGEGITVNLVSYGAETPNK